MKKIFICYSHKDEKIKDRLVEHLKVYESEIDYWHDRLISASENWEEKIIKQLEGCDAAILLISTSFLTSKFIQSVEIPKLLERKFEADINVFPFITLPCAWHKQLSKIQARPKDGIPFSHYKSKHKQEEILTAFAAEIFRLLSTQKVSAKITLDIVQNISEDRKNREREINLNEIYNYFTKKYSDINYIPTSILAYNYPFKKDQNGIAHYYTFNLTTNNEELFNFFKSIKIKNNTSVCLLKSSFSFNKIKNYKTKTEEILARLNNNLIFSLKYKETGEQIDIRYISKTFDDIVYNHFLKLKYSKVLAEIKNLETKKHPLRIAYFNYKIGNFITAIDIITNAIETFKKQGKNTSAFIGYYNLIKLKIFISHNYRVKNRQNELIERLKEIDIEQKFTELRTPENLQTLLWIRNESFFIEAKNSIVSITSKIRDNYYQQLIRDSYYRNNYIDELLNKYAEIDLFLNQNFIVYDNFLEYKDLFSDFLEGLFAWYATNNLQGITWKYLDDWMIQKIIQYADTKILIKLIYRYNLKTINYKKTSKDEDSVTEVIYNLFKEHNSIQESFKKHCEEDNYQFWYTFNNAFSNGIILATFLNLDNKDINAFAAKLLKFLENENKLLYHNTYGHINLFIDEKGKELEREILEQYLLLAIENEKYANESYFWSICRQLKNRDKIKLTNEHFKKLVSLIFENELKDNLLSVAVYVFEILAKNQANDIKKRIIARLNSEFNEDLYYAACYLDILSEKESRIYLPTFIKACIQDVKTYIPENDNNFFRQEQLKRYPKIDKLFDLCFKYNFNTSNKHFKQLKNINLYYNWLLDLEGFDYKLFNPRWVLENHTKHYFERFRKVEKVREYLEKYLEETRDREMERCYFTLYAVYYRISG